MKKLLIVSLLLGVVSSAWASTDWYTTAASSDWFTAANWSGGVPTSTILTNTRTYGSFTNPNYMPVISSGNASAHQLDVGGGPRATQPITATLTLSGDTSTLTVTDYFRIGSSSTSNRWGEFHMDGGTVTVGNYFCIGYGSGAVDVRGWLYMTGGTINTKDLRFANAAGASAEAHLSGDSTINVSGVLTMRPGGTSGSPTTLLDITGNAKVVLNGDQTTLIAGYLASGWILTGGLDFMDNGGSVTFDGVKTTLMVPEPATLCILAIGAFGLIRRK